ncbi:MAG: succinylglutamate desuccinylase/aspartoacylase family protein [Anaerolineae bacterium]|nr:succinylglutamate desuccinylase/aspartoacylase family protein [Anaerolineae bacterium]
MGLEIRREDLPIRQLASGAQLSIPVFHVQGTHPGPRVYLQANIHGPEIAGIGAIYEFLGFLRQQTRLNGFMTLVPSVNPVGLNSKVSGHQTGYADLNETVVGNFNRIYQWLVQDHAAPGEAKPGKVNLAAFVAEHGGADLPTLKRAFTAALGRALDEQWAARQATGMRHGLKLALTIQKMAYSADYVIDLHTAGKAIYHHYTFAECVPSARYFGIPLMVLLDGSFSGVLDEACLLPWIKLRAALAATGRDIPFADFEREAFTPELGSADHLESSAMQADAERVINYLRHKGVLQGAASLPNLPFQSTTHDDYQTYYAPRGGLLLWNKQPGDPVRAGELLATLLHPYAETETSRAGTQTPIYAARDGLLVSQSITQVMHEGMVLCSVATALQPV